MDVARLVPHPFKLMTNNREFDSKRYVSQPDEHTGRDKTVQVAYHGDPYVVIYLRGFSMSEQTKFLNQLSLPGVMLTLKRSKDGWGSIKVTSISRSEEVTP